MWLIEPRIQKIRKITLIECMDLGWECSRCGSQIVCDDKAKFGFNLNGVDYYSDCIVTCEPVVEWFEGQEYDIAGTVFARSGDDARKMFELEML